MARMRRGVRLNLMIPLVIFVFIAVTTSVLCIIFFNDRTRAEQDSAIAKTTLDRYIKPGEVTEFPKTHGDKPGTASYAGWLDGEVKELTKIVIGNETTSLDVIREDAKQTEGQPLLTYIDTLKDERDANDARAGKAQDDLKAAQDQLAAVKIEKDNLAKKIKDTVDELKANYDSLSAGYQDQISKLNANIDALTKQREQSLTDIQNDVKEKGRHDRPTRSGNPGACHRITELMPKQGERLPPVDTSLQPKGQVASILPEENLVYIDRGRNQHVVPGLTFEVFDHSTGISKDERGEMRGKATIEVVSVADDASTCRVVRLAPHQSIIEGDVLANAVYDPNYKFKFVVFGDFDIDNTGIATQADKQRIKTTITQWGGILVNDLSYDTDFLVLGQEPKFPDPLPASTIDPDAIRKHTAALDKYNEYQKLIAQAKTLSIPVLNQNRFLALVGYYKR